MASRREMIEAIVFAWRTAMQSPLGAIEVTANLPDRSFGCLFRGWCGVKKEEDEALMSNGCCSFFSWRGMGMGGTEGKEM